MQIRAISQTAAAASLALLAMLAGALCQESVSIDALTGHRLDSAWYRFVNDSYGIGADIPASGFVYEIGDSNELTLTSADGGRTIVIYGSQDIDPNLRIEEPSIAFAALAEAQIDAMRLGGINVSRERVEPTWFEVGASDTDFLYYQKGLMAVGCPSLAANLWIKYPTTAREEFDQVVQRLSASLSINCPAAD